MEDKITPRKILEVEKPRAKRSTFVDEARLQVLKDVQRVVELAKKLEPEIDKHNKKVIASYTRKFENIKKRGQPISAMRHKGLIEEQFFMQRYAFKEAYYHVFGEYLEQYELPCFPDIDRLSTYWISPGARVEFNGTCFGPSQGKVLLEITSSGGVVELEVLSWTTTRVVASLSVYISGLRPHYGRIWLATGDGRTSNTWPIQFVPLYREYIGSWSKHLGGGLFGDSEDGTAFDDEQLNDSDFNIFLVTSHHSGDGWSKLQSPSAGGQRIEQGYHIGVASCNSANMSIYWHLEGPVGITPPMAGPYWWDTEVNR
jgi:hypothetical protein